MNIKVSGGSPSIKPQLYRTASISTISIAEQQNRFLELSELTELINFLSSGLIRLELADLLRKNANLLVSRAADKIFVGGSAISYLEKPQASFLTDLNENVIGENRALGNEQENIFSNFKLNLNGIESVPPGFKPINISRYGPKRMKKSLRDLDWFLRYLTYAIIAGDPNILVVNVRGLKNLIENACSSTAAIVALQEMRKVALSLVINDLNGQEILLSYFNILLSEFESAPFTDRIRKRSSLDLQGLRIPRIYIEAGISKQKFVMKPSLSIVEKNTVISACYRQIFQRDIVQAYNLKISDLESKVKNGEITMKEFIRFLGKSYLYRKEFFEPFVNSRVVELSFRNFLGRGPGSLYEFRKYFAILSSRGLEGLIDAIINSTEYADYFGEETVPYLRSLGEEPQECRSWGPQINLLNYSSPFKKIPEFITLYSNYSGNLPDQHPYGQGNDPLPLQFGAIFPRSQSNFYEKTAFFGKDTRRILIRKGAGIYNQVSQPRLRSYISSELGSRIFENKISTQSITKKGINFSSKQLIVRASYLRVFGRLVYQEELISLNKLENLFLENQIKLREFIRLLAKTSIFKSLYWEPFYLCKAIEYIHNRLLGRPTYGRREINQYFNIIYKEGFSSFIDALIDSTEYKQTFGDNIVPYERYITSKGIRKPFFKFKDAIIVSSSKKKLLSVKDFISLSNPMGIDSQYRLKQKIAQGVSVRRDQQIIFQLQKNMNYMELQVIIKAIYRQIFERDIESSIIKTGFITLEEAFLAQEISVKDLIKELGSSKLYAKQFYSPYPNSKVIELGTKHFLGRAPSSQAEIRLYNQILASQGIIAFINSLVDSQEYKAVFGDTIVPYRRFPTLPAANFPNTNRIHNFKTNQNKMLITSKLIK